MKATGKDHARVNLAIWGDDEFRSLTAAEQHLYFVLWTSPGLSYCGAGHWHPGRLAAVADGWTRRDVDLAGAGLARKQFVIIDADTDEFLLRSWIKHDGLWRTPNMAVSIANARAELSSKMLRGVVVHEVLKVREGHPVSGSWARSAVVSMLEQAPVDPESLEPFNPGSYPDSNPADKGGSNPGANPWPQNGANPGPTPAPSPAPLLLLQLASLALVRTGDHEPPSSGGGERPRGVPELTPIPEAWSPSDLHRLKAKQLGITNLDAAADGFRNHALAQGRLAADWDAAFASWLASPRTIAADRERRAPAGPQTTTDRVNGWLDIANQAAGNTDRKELA